MLAQSTAPRGQVPGQDLGRDPLLVGVDLVGPSSPGFGSVRGEVSREGQVGDFDVLRVLTLEHLPHTKEVGEEKARLPAPCTRTGPVTLQTCSGCGAMASSPPTGWASSEGPGFPPTAHASATSRPSSEGPPQAKTRLAVVPLHPPAILLSMEYPWMGKGEMGSGAQAGGAEGEGPAQSPRRAKREEGRGRRQGGREAAFSLVRW